MPTDSRRSGTAPRKTGAIVRTAVTIIVVLASIGPVATVAVWLSWHAPAALSEEDTALRPLIVDGVGRPTGPDAEVMGVLDLGVIVTGPPPPGGVPTDAPRPRRAPLGGGADRSDCGRP